MRYRADIDGLRAVAILTVVAFHALPQAMPGGFIGVDIFFVISGYLISGIIIGDLRENRFSIAGFYGRRIRRIFPALVLMLAVALLIGRYVLFPDEFTDLGTHTLAGAAFVANFALWHDTGYFDTEAASKPLLHLWSLGIEEQFYIVWPLLLWATRKNRTLALWTVAAVVVVSFGLNLIGVYVIQREALTFYIPLTRIWELASGSLLALLSSPTASDHDASSAALRADLGTLKGERGALEQAMAFLGVGFIVCGLLVIDKDSLFPGWRALLPIMGAVLLIAAGPSTWVNRVLLSNRVAVFIGLISFPLYLWHWPLLTFQSMLWPGSGVARGAAVVLAVILATSTFLFIEKPVRAARKSRTLVTRSLFVANCFVAATGALIYLHFLGRDIPPEAAQVLSATGDWALPPTTGLDRSGKLSVRELSTDRPNEVTLYIGDSHMQQYWSRLKYLTEQRRPGMRSIEFATYPGCPPMPGVTRVAAEFKCVPFFDQALERARSENVKAVVFEGWWEWYFLPQTADGSLEAPIYRAGDSARHPIAFDSPEARALFDQFGVTIQSLVAANKQVYILLSNPTSAAYSPLSMVQRVTDKLTPTEAVDRAEYERRAAPVTTRLREIAERAGAVVVDPVPFLCEPTRCLTTLPDGTPRYKDTNHLRSSFAEQQNYLDRFNY